MKKWIVLGIGLVLAAGACSSGGSGNFRLFLTDAPIEGLENVFITFDKVEVEKDGAFIELTLKENKIDLLTLRDREECIVDTELDPGTYTAVRLTIGEAEIVYNGQTWTLAINPPLVASVPVEFTVAGDGTIECVLDFDARQSVILGTGSFELVPAIVVKRIGY